MEKSMENVKKFGFGLMRLPTLEGGEIDQKQVEEMVDLFLENGFNYFDTAWGYHNGMSEVMAGKALVQRHPRESFYLATKLPAWNAPNEAEAKKMFDTSLERTGAGYFDFYLLHNLGNARAAVFDQYGIWDYLQEKKEQGLIKHLGFSFHDTADKLDRVLTEHPYVDFVQLQINYADWDNATVQSRLNYETARKHGKPVVIMEPVKGGNLAQLGGRPGEIMKEANPNASQASWALRYAASLPGVLTVLSGMSTLDQMKDNISFMKDMKPLTKEEYAVLDRVKEELEKIPTVPCTACQYCVKGCPMQINIPGVFKAMNTYTTYQYKTAAQGNFNFETREGGKPSECLECGQCESACPQSIGIIEELKKAAALFE